ncbi:MAG: cell surface protein [Bacteroides sp.]|nr:cell surface protein [Bacteroides sp.]
MISSCNEDNLITSANAPVIILPDDSDGVYEVRVGRSITISVDYKNIEGAVYDWKVDGVTVANTPQLTFSSDQTGEYYVDLYVTTPAGSAHAEMRIDVLPLGLPYISLPIAGDELLLKEGTDYVLTPEFANSTGEELEVVWTIDGSVYEHGTTLHYHASQLGTYSVEVTATNSDGTESRGFTIKVVDQLPFELFFPSQSYFQPSTTRYTFPGRPVWLQPIISGLESKTFSWSIDGTPVDCDTEHYLFTPDKPGEYTVNLMVDGSASASVKVVCVDATEASRRRAATASCSSWSNIVYEWVPGPGQFIGDTQTGGMTGNETTHAAALAWAESRIKANAFVSLGGFGGYIIVGFDHSVAARSTDYDFSILANAFFNLSNDAGGSNESGIVYVSQDVNGNGLPDDEWYELRGSESSSSGTIRNYAVTYYRPSAPRMNVQWTDNLGQSGTIDYLASFHRQDYYYPAWIDADSYTLRGTRLAAQTSQNSSTGLWDNSAYDWGYADNMGSDTLSSNNGGGGEGQRNGFHISNAMMPDGTPIELQYVDFIKVQTGINSKAGWLGEVSTEIAGFQDLSIK